MVRSTAFFAMALLFPSIVGASDFTQALAHGGGSYYIGTGPTADEDALSKCRGSSTSDCSLVGRFKGCAVVGEIEEQAFFTFGNTRTAAEIALHDLCPPCRIRFLECS